MTQEKTELIKFVDRESNREFAKDIYLNTDLRELRMMLQAEIGCPFNFEMGAQTIPVGDEFQRSVGDIMEKQIINLRIQTNQVKEHVKEHVKPVDNSDKENLCNQVLLTKNKPEPKEEQNIEQSFQSQQQAESSEAEHKHSFHPIQTTNECKTIPSFVEYQLSKDEEDDIMTWMNKKKPVNKILEFMEATEDRSKEFAVRAFIAKLLSPPKQPPENSKRLFIKTAEKTLPLYHYKADIIETRSYYTFLVIGETGTGKTTLLDAFVNHLTGMNFVDQWRWKLADENHMKVKRPGESQTSEIIRYVINDVRNEFNIIIIDSPGFGDTKGYEQDDIITNQFENYFKELNEIDYVLLTVKSSETRLKPVTKYVYDRIQQIFGKDSKSRFLLMCTFADDRIPVVLHTMDDLIYYKKFFTFNNFTS